MRAIELVAKNIGIPFPELIELTMVTLFFLSLYLVRDKVKPVYLILFLFSPITITHLLNMDFVYFSYEFFSMSVVLYFLDMGRKIHSFIVAVFLSVLDTPLSIGFALLFLIKYFESRDMSFLLISSILILLILGGDLYYANPLLYLTVFSLTSPSLISLNPFLFVLSLLFSIFPSTIFPLLVFASKNRISYGRGSLSLMIYSFFSFFSSPIPLVALFLLLSILNYRLKNPALLKLSILLMAVLNLYNTMEVWSNV